MFHTSVLLHQGIFSTRPPLALRLSVASGSLWDMTSEFEQHLADMREAFGLPPQGLPDPRVCSYELCDRPIKARGLCFTHWRQQRDGKPLTPIMTPEVRAELRRMKAEQKEAIRPVRPTECSYEGCYRKVHVVDKALCQSHYIQWRNGDALRPIKEYMNR